MEFVSEINRRYGAIKRQELAPHYKIVDSTKYSNYTTKWAELNYTSNDFDILDEINDFEKNSPFDKHVKLKETLDNPKVSNIEKISKLTDYQIVRNF